MNDLTPQFLNDEDGNAMYAVLPIAQYNHLLSRAMEEETDFYYELTDEEIAYFERAEQQSKWLIEAESKYYETLDYWEEHNGSFNYSLKIIKAVESLEDNLAENP